MVATLWMLVAIVTLAPFLAGLVPVLGRTISDRALHLGLGFAAGAMLAVTFLHVLPRVFETGGEQAAITLGAAFVALYLLEGVTNLHGHTSHEHAHDHEEGDHFHRASRTPLVALLALGLHMFLDGLILPPAFHVSDAVGISLAVAIALHKLPAGLAAGTIASTTRMGQRRSTLTIAAIASMTAIGALLGATLLDVAALTPHLLALAGATLLFVAVAELLPELHHGPHKARVAIGMVLGFLAIPVLDKLLTLANLTGAH